MSSSDRNLTPFASEHLELLIDTNTGESFASISAIARMVTTAVNIIQATQIIRHCTKLEKLLTISPPFEAEIQTAAGMRSVTLLVKRQFESAPRNITPISSTRWLMLVSEYIYTNWRATKSPVLLLKSHFHPPKS
jgi:hypothetical protein